MERLIEIDFSRCVKALWHNMGVILLSAVLGALLGLGVAAFSIQWEDAYQSKVDMYSVANTSYTEVVESAKVMMSYAEIAKSMRVSERAAEILNDSTLDASTINTMIQIEYNNSQLINSNMIRIYATSNSPEKAVSVVNAVADAYATEMLLLAEKESVRRVDYAQTAEQSYSVKKALLQWIILAAVGVAFIVCAVIVMKEVFSVQLSNVKDGSLSGKLPLLGVVPEYHINRDANKPERPREGY